VIHTVGELAASDPDLLLIDLHCGGRGGGLTGWEILTLARRHPGRDAPVVMCSADLAALREDRMRLVAEHGPRTPTTRLCATPPPASAKAGR